MKTLSIFLLSGMFLFLAHIQAAACSLNPTAKIVTDPSGSTFFHGDPVVFDGTTSTANCGSISQYRWRVRVVGGSYTTVSWSSVYSHTFTLEPHEGEKDYQMELRVRNSAGKYGFKTITVTVKRHYTRHYYLTDHLGSVRVTVNDAGDPVGWDDYYPFGLQMPGRTQNASNPNDDQKFTGYELEQQGDLNIYHAEARMYDPVIGRFMQVDPLAGLFPDWSPYTYVFNNPLIYTDPTGMAPVCEEAQNCDEFYDKGVVVENRLGSWRYLGDNQWETISIADNATELTSGFAEALHRFNNITDDFYNFGDRTIAENSLGVSTTSLLDNPATWLVGGVGAFAKSGGFAAKTGASLSTNGVKLNQQLASEAQMSQAGRTIISSLREGSRLAQQYGGKSADWVKKSSSSFSKNGKTFETHWYQNVSTGQRVEFKTKLIKGW